MASIFLISLFFFYFDFLRNFVEGFLADGFLGLVASSAEEELAAR